MVQLKAAARRVDISPQEADKNKIDLIQAKWEKTNGPLQARILVLDTDGVRAVIVGLDSCFVHETSYWAKPGNSGKNDPSVVEFRPALLPGTRRLWAQAAGCPEDHVFVSATHTHTSPVILGGSSREAKIQDIHDAIVAARKDLEPATMSINSILGHFPPPAGMTLVTPGLARLRRPTLIPIDPPRHEIDDTLSVLRISRNRDSKGAPIALVVNYGVHSTLSGETNGMSPDFTGEAMVKMEDLFDPAHGKKFASIFIPGCCGDVAPPNLKRDYKTVKEEAALYLSNHVKNACAVGDPLSPVVVRGAVSRFTPRTRPYYGDSKNPKPEPEVVVSGLRLADEAVLLGASGELFSGYRGKIADWAMESQPRWAHVLVGSMVNGYSGYLPRAEDFRVPTPGRANPHYIMEKDKNGVERETYEMSTTPYTEGIERDLLSEVNAVLARLE